MVPGRNMAIIAGALACLIVPLLLVPELLRALAERACMLEGLGVVAAYRRAFRVAVDNLGSAVVLPEVRREALEAGADAFISKGDPPERLLRAMEELSAILKEDQEP